MKHFRILDVKHLRTDDSGRVNVFNSLLNKEIILPYPEFHSDCILIIANPIDLAIYEEGVTVGEYSERESVRTCYFLKPYSVDYYNYWRKLLQDEWVPFFPEQKEIINVEDGNLIPFYKDVSFNKNWQPISHALYVSRIHAEHPDELDYMDIGVDEYEEIGLQEYEYNNAEDNFDVYATEYFGDIEEDDCQDECWACAKLLQKEMLFIIQITTQIDGKQENHLREVLGFDLEDALNQVFQEDGKIKFSDVTSYRVYHNEELIMHDGRWIK